MLMINIIFQKGKNVFKVPSSSESDNISSNENANQLNLIHKSPMSLQDNSAETGRNQTILIHYKTKKFVKVFSLRYFKSECLWHTYDIDKCVCRVKPMMKWIEYRSNAKHKMAMPNHVDVVCKLQVARNWEHMDIIVETLLFGAQQSKTQRGYEKDHTNVGEIHNCDYLDAFLYLKSKAITRQEKKLKLEMHMKWVSPTV